MSEIEEKTVARGGVAPVDTKPTPSDEKQTIPQYDSYDDLIEQAEVDLNVTGDELLQAKEWASAMSLEETRTVLEQVLKVHEHDTNFPHTAILKIQAFLENEDIFENPEKHQELIDEVKMEAALITQNSPYAEVRAVVDPTDDVNMPSSTVRAWVIGLILVAALAFINEFFQIRYPNISFSANVAQLLCVPAMQLWELIFPDVGFTVMGKRISLNPGKFSRKEHMLITVMANVGINTPYTNYIIWAQVLPQYFNQPYARSFSYQILLALATNFIGYGIAGLTRRFLVYPSYCVWPASLSTVALNASFHSEGNPAVKGPFNTVFKMSRLRFFLLAFLAMFVYFWFPNFIFQALSYFNWMTWIAPDNVTLAAITGTASGIGLNPWPTFDWNQITIWGDPLVMPWLSMVNMFLGAILGYITIVGLWFTNGLNTSYLPINSNYVFNRFGSRYNISKIIDSRGLLDVDKYHAYSPAYLAAGNVVVYIYFFSIYTATISYAYLYHRHEIAAGFRNLWHNIRTGGDRLGASGYVDIHNKLMASYSEVPEWWYGIILLISIAFGVAGIAAWPTYTSVGVVFYGIAFCLLFVIPIGIIKAITGVEVTLNVLAEFIGGSWVPGNALAMNFFKSYGYVTCAHALAFSNDLKLAHYVKVPPKHIFWGQIVATLVSTFVCVGTLQFQIDIEDVCTPHQKNHFTCPGINTFFTASVLWGTLAPPRIFGTHGYYKLLLIGFPVGFVLPIMVFYAQKYFKKEWLHGFHPVVFFYGPLNYSNYGLGNIWPAIPISWLSMIYLKKRYLGLWAKYNYVLSAAFAVGIAISAIIIFFAVQYQNVSIDWWGNNVPFEGCDGNACTRYILGDDEYFGAGPGEYH